MTKPGWTVRATVEVRADSESEAIDRVVKVLESGVRDGLGLVGRFEATRGAPMVFDKLDREDNETGS